MPEHDRFFSFEQVFNFRDMGGYRGRDGRTVRWRRLLRTAEHHRMSEAEARRLRDEAQIATVIDLRAEEEAQHRLEPGPIVTLGARRHVFAMGDPKAKYSARDAGTWRPDFTSTLDGGARNWASAIRVLAEDGAYPVLLHCVTGKDRTGVLGALILGVLGVEDDAIVEDYALSQRGMDEMVASMRERGIIRPGEALNPALAVVPAAMREMLDDLHRRYDSASDFLSAHGVDEATLDRVRTLLLE
jgi:protein tyrosine/serine phosphatase